MWIAYSFAAMVLLASMVLIIKQVALGGVASGVILFWLFVVGTVSMGCHLLVARQSLRVSGSVWVMIAVAGLLSYLGNLVYFRAMAAAPNLGYPVAIEGCKAVLVLIASVFLFDAGLSLPKAAGVVLCAAGVYLITR